MSNCLSDVGGKHVGAEGFRMCRNQQHQTNLDTVATGQTIASFLACGENSWIDLIGLLGY
jgi:hypothetical protein